MSIDHDLGAGGLAGLAGREPGAELAGVLDGIDASTLTGQDLAAYVRARWRVHNRAEALLLAGMRELGMAQDGGTGRLASSDEFSGDEVAALFGWSRTMASRRLDLADDLFGRLPALGEALWRGGLDEPKVRAISEVTGDLTVDHARAAVAVVLPEAAGLAVMALRERLEEVVLALDPQWAERRRRRAESRGRVELSMTASGTATRAVLDAPVVDGIASMARIEALAAVVRGLGVLTPIGLLRCQVGTRLLDGSTAGMTDHDIAVLLAAEYHATTNPDDDPDDDPDDGPGPDDGPEDGPEEGPDQGPDDGPDGGPDDGGPDDEAPDEAVGTARAVLPTPGTPAEQGALDVPGLPGLPDVPPDSEPAPGAPAPREPRAGRLRQGTV
ncbi:DUF222 domain-containing protein, partial [Actinomycetospora lutea]|uniref:DUF222 domain-containing protein n=1 Tax=Actinomycetospora lutea TaxID=663604 RepID=UPI0023666A0A